MKPALRRPIVWAAQIALTVTVTYFLFRALRLSWSEVAQVDLSGWRPRLLPFVSSVLLLLVVFVYLVRLWARMIRSLGGPALGLWESIGIFFVSNLGRYVPGKIWQMAGLAYLAGKKGVSLPVASSAAVLGQTYSLGAAALLAALALALGATSGFPRELAPWAVGLGMLVAVLTMVPPALRMTLSAAFRLSRRGGETPRLDPWFGPRWLSLYVPGWIGYGIAFALLWSSFSPLPPVSWPAAVGGFAGAYFLGYAALFAPAGVGIREGVLAVLLAPWMGVAEATLLAVIARLWMTLVEFIPVAGIAGANLLSRLRANNGTPNHVVQDQRH